MIKYTKESLALTEDGYYVVRVENERGGELTVAEYVVDTWYQVGIDYDVWQYDAGTVYELTVICRLDLEAIVKSSCVDVLLDANQRVRKKSGSWWEGRVVGAYSTKQTPVGYCVQLDTVENGPVQIYPASALEVVPVTAPAKDPVQVQSQPSLLDRGHGYSMTPKTSGSNGKPTPPRR
jgi:hypothetical protein